MKNRRGIAGIFRVIAGGYLIYLAVKLIRDGILTGEMLGKARVFGILASALFIVAGAFFIIQAFRWMAKQNREEEEQEEETAEAEVQQEEEQAPSAPSLFDRAGLGAFAYDEDEDEEMSEEDDDTQI